MANKNLVQNKIGKKDNSIVFRAYRPLSSWLCRLLAKTPLTGDHISIFLMFFTPFGFYLLASQRELAALIILQLSLLLDCMDGQLSRLKPSGNRLNGYYYEAVWHEMLFPLFYLSLGIISFSAFGKIQYLYLGVFIMASIYIINALMHRRVMIYDLKTYFNKSSGYVPRTKTWRTELLRILTCPSYVFTYAFVLYFLGYLPYMILPYGAVYLLILIYTFYRHVLKPRRG